MNWIRPITLAPQFIRSHFDCRCIFLDNVLQSLFWARIEGYMGWECCLLHAKLEKAKHSQGKSALSMHNALREQKCYILPEPDANSVLVTTSRLDFVLLRPRFVQHAVLLPKIVVNLSMVLCHVPLAFSFCCLCQSTLSLINCIHCSERS